MADKTVDPATLAELGRIMHTIAHDPKHRKTVIKAIKDKFPSFEMPDDVAREDVLGTVKDEFAERDRKQAAKDAEVRLAQQRKGLIDGSLIEGRKFTEEQVKEIEKDMETRGIADYEAGALIYAGAQKPAAATPEIQTAGNWSLPKVANPFNTAALATDARNKAFAVIGEIQARNRAA